MAYAGGKRQVEDIYSRGSELEQIADPGTAAAIDVSRSGEVQIVTAAAETNTLAVPTFVGQRLIITMKTRVGGNRVITVASAFNAAGNTIITLDTAGDAICLEGSHGSAGVLKWNEDWTNGPSLS
jgi:hypothetical protein